MPDRERGRRRRGGGAAVRIGTTVLVAGALLLAVGGASQEAATLPDEAELDRRTAEVASRLRCPVCRNQSVLESSSDLARRMQGVIRERLAAGESPEEVQAYFVSRYGEWILLQPEPEGINLLVYLLPAVALLAGVVIVTVALRRWVSAPEVDEPTPGTTPDRGSPP